MIRLVDRRRCWTMDFSDTQVLEYSKINTTSGNLVSIYEWLEQKSIKYSNTVVDEETGQYLVHITFDFENDADAVLFRLNFPEFSVWDSPDRQPNHWIIINDHTGKSRRKNKSQGD